MVIWTGDREPFIPSLLGKLSLGSLRLNQVFCVIKQIQEGIHEAQSHRKPGLISSSVTKLPTSWCMPNGLDKQTFPKFIYVFVLFHVNWPNYTSQQGSLVQASHRQVTFSSSFVLLLFFSHFFFSFFPELNSVTLIIQTALQLFLKIITVIAMLCTPFDCCVLKHNLKDRLRKT